MKYLLGEATRLYLEFSFTIVKCGNVPMGLNSSCKETLTLYSAAVKEEEFLPINWHNETKW